MQTIANVFDSITPDGLFLLAAAGFLGVIMAFLVPLSVEIISKVSAKYSSDIIVRLYKRSFINRIFTGLLLFTLGAMITTRFFISDEFLSSFLGKSIMWSLLTLSTIITVLIGYLIRRMEKFISDDSMPLKILYNDIRKSLAIKSIVKGTELFSSPNPVKSTIVLSTSVDRHGFIQAIEGIGDILCYQIGRHSETLVIEGLKNISQSIHYLYQIRELDPNSFNQLVYDDTFQHFINQNNQDNSRVHSFCFTNPDKYLDGLATPFNQLKRIYKTSLEQQNSEIARLAMEEMNNILYYLSSQRNNNLAIDLFLKKFIECLQLALRHNDESNDQGIHWYSNILSREPHIGADSFCLEYLDIYNRYLMSFASHMIAENYSNAFFNFVRSLIANYAIPNYQRGKVWGYHYLLKASDLNNYRKMNEELGIQRQVRLLAIKETQLDTLEQLQQWLDRFDKLSQLIRPHLTKTKEREAQRLDEIIKSNAIKHLKRRRLLRAAYAISAHCLLHNRYGYIKYLWQQSSKNEPNLAIVPTSTQQVLDDYFRRTKILSSLDQGGLSIESYFRQYYVLLLARNIQEGSDSYVLSPFDSEQLNIVKRSIDELLQTTNELSDSSLFNVYSLKQNLLTKKISALLNSIKKEVAKQLLHRHKKIKISQKRHNDYKKQILASWDNHCSLRKLFTNYLQGFENQTHKNVRSKPRGWGIEELVNKSLLLESWDPTDGIGTRHGRSLANSENSFLFDALAESCQWASEKSFTKILSQIPTIEESLIISTRWTHANFLLQQENFTLSQPNQAAKTTEAENLSSFSGYYDHDHHNIPVFVIDYSGSGHQMLILNRKKVGRIVQMPFYSITGRKHLKLQNEMFYFKVEDLATNPRLIKYYIQQELPWLKEKASLKEQREYLRQLVLIKVLENMRFEKAKDFIGYKITIKGKSQDPVLDDQTGLLPI